jgi:hypothetical protein
MAAPGTFDVSMLDNMSDTQLHELAISVSLSPASNWPRPRVVAALVVHFMSTDACKQEVSAMSRVELHALAAKAGIPTKSKKSRAHLVAELTAYRTLRDSCLRNLEVLSTEELKTVAKHSLAGVESRNWSRQHLLKSLMLHFAAGNAYNLELDAKSLTDLRLLAGRHGMFAKFWSRSRCISELLSARREIPALAEPKSRQVTVPPSEEALSQAYAEALERCVISSPKKLNLALRCESIAAKHHLDERVLARLAILWTETARRVGYGSTGRRKKADLQATDVDFNEAFVALAAAGEGEARNVGAARALINGVDIASLLPGEEFLYEDDVSLSDESEANAENGNEDESLSCRLADTGQSLVRADDTNIEQEEEDVGSANDAKTDELVASDHVSVAKASGDIDFINDECKMDEHTDAALVAALRSLPGGSVAPLELIASVADDVDRLARVLRSLPWHLGLMDAVQLMEISARNELGFESLLPAADPSGPSVAYPSRLPTMETARIAQSRHEALLWRMRPDAIQLEAAPRETNREIALLVSAVLQPSGLQISKFIQRFLISVYRSVEAMAEDEGELVDVAEVLGETKRRRLVGVLLLQQVDILRGKMAIKGRDAETPRRLVRAFRSSRRVLQATFEQVLGVFEGDADAAHAACASIHGTGGGDAATHRKLVDWLLDGSVARAHWWAAAVLQRFASSIVLAQTGTLLSFLQLAGVGAGPASALETIDSATRAYYSLHAAGRSDSAGDASRRYEDTAAALQLVRAAGGGEDGAVVVARLMERFGGDLARARRADDADLREALKFGGSLGGRLTAEQLRRALR